MMNDDDDYKTATIMVHMRLNPEINVQFIFKNLNEELLLLRRYTRFFFH